LGEETLQFQLDGAQGSGLTSWKREPTLQQLKADWEGAKQAHGLHISKIDHWGDLLHVRGAAKPPKRAGRSSVQPKLIRRQAEWRYSALTEPFLGTQNLFKVSPTTFEDAQGSRKNELILNWQFRTKLNRVKFIDDFVRATVDEGTSILRVGWKRQTVKIKVDAPVYEHVVISDEQQFTLFQQAVELKQTNPKEFAALDPAVQASVDYFEESGEATVATQVGTEKVDAEKIILNHPTAEVLNPKNVFIDPSCEGDLNKALFVCVSFETNKADLVKEGKRYKNLDKINWEANTPLSQPDHETQTPQTFNLVDRSRKKVVAYEYWGFFPINDDDVLVPFVCTWIGDVIIRMELNPFPDQKLPFVVVPYLPVKRELMGEPDAELLEDQQAIAGAVTRGMIDLMGRSANGQQGFAKGMLDPLNRRRYENGQDYEFNPNVSPQLGLIEHKYPEIPASALNMLQMQNQEAEALTGVKSFGGGMSGEAYGEVAAGIRGMMDAASKREMAILRRLAQGISELGRKIIAMNQVFLSDEETIRITNMPADPAQAPTESFETIRREDIQGEYDLIVDISTAEVDNAQAENLSFMLQTMGDTIDMELKLLILAEIARLKRMPELEGKLRNFKPKPDPMQQKLQELEIKKLELECAEIQARTQAHVAKAEKDEATAEKTEIETAALATGESHNRDMEKLQSQSQGNKELTITKALVTPKKEGETKPDVEAAVGYTELSNGAGRFGNQNSSPIPAQTVDTLPQTQDLTALGGVTNSPEIQMG
jgi:hypothetical protein